MGFRVWGLGFGAWGLKVGCREQGLLEGALGRRTQERNVKFEVAASGTEHKRLNPKER